MRGLAVGASCFVAYSGKVARLYRVDMQLQRCEALEAVQCTGNAMAIADASHIIGMLCYMLLCYCLFILICYCFTMFLCYCLFYYYVIVF
jgi:hypothetical protein